MRFSPIQINQLKSILLALTGKEHTAEELQEAGLKILRFVYVSEQRKHLNDTTRCKPQSTNMVLPREGQTSQEREYERRK